MKYLVPGLDLDLTFQQVAQSTSSLLMLDYDGTLAPFTPERDQAFVYPELNSVLSKLSQCDRTRLVLISGRAIANLRPLLQFEPLPEIWGSHGGETLTTNGRYRCVCQSEAPSEGLAQVYWWAREVDLLARTERKPTGIAFHWRGLEPAEALDIEKRLTDHWVDRLGRFQLELHHFDGGIEIRVVGISKADAVNRLVAQDSDNSARAYLGDDATDEDAFRALGDRGLSVLVRPELRETAADLWITPPDELLSFLQRWLEASES